MALGTGSSATGANLATGAYLVGGTATSEVNVGARRVTGVSAGAADTDAVNVAQLKTTVHYDLDANGTVNYNSVTLNKGGTPTTISNVANATLTSTSTEAVTGQQLDKTNTNVTNLGNTVTNLDARVTTINDKGTRYFHANSDGTDSKASGVTGHTDRLGTDTFNDALSRSGRTPFATCWSGTASTPA